MKKRRLIILGISLLLLVALGAAVACGVTSADSAEKPQTLAARDDSEITVSGNGYIQPSDDSWLTFGISGRVANINVEEGDEVKENDILAKLETDALELAKTRAEVDLIQAEVALTEAQLALTQAQLAQRTAEYELKTTRDKKDILDLALLNAEINLDQAKYNLEQTSDLYTWSDIKTAKADVDDAERYLEDLLEKVGKFLPKDEEGDYPNILEYVFGEDYPKTPGYEFWQEDLIHAQRRLNAAEDRLEAMLSFSDTTEVAIKRRQVEAAEKAEAQAQKNLDDLVEDITIMELRVEAAKQSTEQAQQSMRLAQQSIQLAQESLGEAERQLREATITAPFDGVVARIHVEEGDIITNPYVAPLPTIQLVNYEQMELLVEIDEMDIPYVNTGQDVAITVDALPGAEFLGEVETIIPVPKVIGGVVVYDVKIKFDVPDGSAIRVGMNATAHLTSATQSDVHPTQ